MELLLTPRNVLLRMVLLSQVQRLHNRDTMARRAEPSRLSTVLPQCFPTPCPPRVSHLILRVRQNGSFA